MVLGNILKSCGWLLLCSVLCADFSMATNSDSSEAEASPHRKTTSSLQITADDDPKLLHLLALPSEILVNIALDLDEPKDILSLGTACKTLHAVSEADAIWKKHFRNLALLPVDDSSRLTFLDRVREHFILMDMRIAIAGEDEEELAKLLKANSKFCRIRGLIIERDYSPRPIMTPSMNNLLCKYGNTEAMARKFHGLPDGKNGYKKAFEAATKFNEKQVAKGDPVAIERKVSGLGIGYYGYAQDPQAVREFNEELVAKGNPEAIKRKVKGLLYGCHGYAQDPQAAIQMIKKYRVHLFSLCKQPQT